MLLLPCLATFPLFLASTAATSILALAGDNLVIGIVGGKYKCFGLAATIIAITIAIAIVLPVVAASFPSRVCKLIYVMTHTSQCKI